MFYLGSEKKQNYIDILVRINLAIHINNNQQKKPEINQAIYWHWRA